MKRALFLGLMALSLTTFAAADLKGKCGDDTAKLAKAKAKGCGNLKNEAGIFECVEHNEKKVSKACYDEHEIYETETGHKDND